MRYIHFEFGTGYAGCDEDEWDEYEDDITPDELNEIAAEYANENAASFEYVATGWDADFESEDDRAAYYDDVWYDWEEVSEEYFFENRR